MRRLSAAGMIVFLDRVERINGAFAVPKPDGGLRFIFNGTAANEVFFEPLQGGDSFGVTKKVTTQNNEMTPAAAQV